MDAKAAPRYAKFAIYVFVVVLLNIAGLTIFFRADLTENKIYSLSKVSKTTVHSLSEPLTINVFFTKNLPAPYNTVERYLKDLLGEYALYGGKKFNYRFFDVTPEDEGGTAESTRNRELAHDYGLYPVQIQAIEKDEVKFRKAYMGLVIIHGDMMEKIPTITTTDGLEYKLTTSIMKLGNKISALLKLKSNVNVKLYLSPALKEVAPYMGIKDMPQIPGQIRQVVEGLNRKMYNRLTYTLAEPTDQPDLDRLANTYNLMHLKWPNLEGTNVKAGEGVIGLVLEYNGSTSVLPAIQVYRLPLFGLRYNLYKPEDFEEMISQSIESLIGINENIGYLADHGTLQTFVMPGTTTKEPISNFDQLVSQSYTLKQVRLRDAGIPKGLKCLIIAGPTENFSDEELYQIDQALMQGTNLALFLDKFQEVQMGQPGSPFGQQSQYVPVNTGIEKLLDHYGVKVKSSIVLDQKCYRQRVPVEYGGGQQDIFFAPIIQDRFINNELPYMRNIKSLVALAVSPIEVNQKRIDESGIKAEKLFSSSEKSWEMKDMINLNPMFIKPPASEKDMQSLPLAYILEGVFKSSFAEKPIPEKQDSAQEGMMKQVSAEKAAPDDKPAAAHAGLSKIQQSGTFLPQSSKPGKIFLIGSSQMLSNNILDSEGLTPNSTFVMNILDILNDRLDISLMRSKTLSINPLEETQAQTKMYIKTFNIAGVPALVVCFGLFIWLRRRYRKKQIELMFAKRGNS